MLARLTSSLGTLLFVALAGASTAPGRRLLAQGVDSTGMPSLESLAMEAGRASRRHPIGAVSPAFLCELGHPLVDSASVAACAALDPGRGAAVTAAFARGLEVAVTRTTEGDSTVVLPICPADLDRVTGRRVLVARVTAPVVGMRDGLWEGRLTVELRCRPPGAGSGRVTTMGKEYLYQWSGRAWELYQHSWWRGS